MNNNINIYIYKRKQGQEQQLLIEGREQSDLLAILASPGRTDVTIGDSVLDNFLW